MRNTDKFIGRCAKCIVDSIGGKAKGIGYVLVVIKGRDETHEVWVKSEPPSDKTHITERQIVPDENGTLYGVKLQYCKERGSTLLNAIKKSLKNFVGMFPGTNPQRWIVIPKTRELNESWKRGK